MSITTTTSAKPTILFREACLPDVPRRSAITVPPAAGGRGAASGTAARLRDRGRGRRAADEGEAYAARPSVADVPVTTGRHDGISHDVMALDPLSAAHATRAALAPAAGMLRAARTPDG
ncbi:hypothetical protein ABT273_35930 [Streptomyces humidus]|uniref:hypothetical protein n=1 Tax=Streptomyces humidus TaxID=52259 RepID=UPI00332CBDBC